MIEAVDELREVRNRAHGLAAAGVGALSDEERCEVALEARRLRELADHLEVHALGALDESGYTLVNSGMPAAMWCDGWLLWTTPSGKTFWAQHHGKQRAGPAPPLTMAA